jgi:hypothetical protein
MTDTNYEDEKLKFIETAKQAVTEWQSNRYTVQEAAAAIALAGEESGLMDADFEGVEEYQEIIDSARLLEVPAEEYEEGEDAAGMAWDDLVDGIDRLSMSV